MSSAAPLILAGAALLLVSAKGKKKSGRTGSAKKAEYSLPKNVALPQIYGPLATTAPRTTNSSLDWIERQKALFAISQIQFSMDGKTVYLCSKCDPKGFDGNPGSDTKKAVKAFQALAGITPTGNWGQQEDAAMWQVIKSFNDGIHIPCDPLVMYPSPLGCFIQAGGGYGLEPSLQDAPAPKPEPSSDDPGVDPAEPADDSPKYGPDELLVTDGDCNYIEHQDDAFFTEQNNLIIMSALDGLTDGIAAEEIHEEMMGRYIPMCLFLGREQVGQGVLTWWNTNLAHVASKLKSYDLLPELLEEDAVKYGLS